MNPAYRILSFDGGGIRGLLSLILLQRIERSFPAGWTRPTCWPVRPSAFVKKLRRDAAGGIIALGLAHGVPVAELRRLYEERGKLVFDDSWWDDLCEPPSPRLWRAKPGQDARRGLSGFAKRLRRDMPAYARKLRRGKQDQESCRLPQVPP